MTQPAENILVLGVGNPLMRDDGLGPQVIETLLSGYDFPDNVELLDAGTMSFTILNLLIDKDHLIVVDAVRATGHPPGSVMRLSPEQIALSQVHHTMHDVAVTDVLQAMQLIGSAPSTIAVAVQVNNVDEMVPELSPEVEASVPIAAALVLDELEHLGARAVPRDSDVHDRVLAALRSYSPQSGADNQEAGSSAK
jgi:hydrogenase maturation protease